MHADIARDGYVEDDKVVSVLVNEDVGALRANNGGGFDWLGDDRLDDVVDPVSTTLMIFLSKHLVRNCFAVAF